MTTIIIAVVVAMLCTVGGVMLLLIMLPVAYASAYAQEENKKELLKEESARVNNALKIARTNKVLADQEVLESRRALIDSNVAIKELQSEALRLKLGYAPDNIDGDRSFTVTDYHTDHD